MSSFLWTKSNNIFSIVFLGRCEKLFNSIKFDQNLEGFVKERNLPEKKMFRRGPLNVNEYEEVVINGVDWNEICMLHYGDASASFKSFYDTHLYYLDEMSPFHEVTLKEFRLLTKPWITKEILTKCDARDALLKDIKSETDPEKLFSLNKEYKLLRNQITTEKRDGKKKVPNCTI